MNQALQAIAAKYNITACPPPEFIPCGVPALDAITGGIPKGRIVDIHGGEDAGKTALALTLAKGTVLYIDAENKLTPWMVRGRKDFYIMHPETLEAALNICRIAAKGFDTIVLDTIEALPEARDPWETIDEPREGSREKLLSMALAVLVPVLLSNGCTLILVNQMRNIPGVIYGRADHSTGGRALRHYAALRLEVRRIEQVKKGQSVTGQKVKVWVSKNKYGSPGGIAEILFDYGKAV